MLPACGKLQRRLCVGAWATFFAIGAQLAVLLIAVVLLATLPEAGP